MYLLIFEYKSILVLKSNSYVDTLGRQKYVPAVIGSHPLDTSHMVSLQSHDPWHPTPNVG